VASRPAVSALDLFAAAARSEGPEAPAIVSPDGLTARDVARAMMQCCGRPFPLTDAERELLRSSGMLAVPPRRCRPSCTAPAHLVITHERFPVCCPFCDQLIEPDQKTCKLARLGWREAHQDCAMTMGRQRIPDMAIGSKGRSGAFAMRAHPDCARCGLPYDDHGGFGMVGPFRLCEDLEPYERAPGVVGIKPHPNSLTYDVTEHRATETAEDLRALEQEYLAGGVLA
jgi:hypothetical protein